ncbi:hypothetical protein GEMRC1_011528 [Eukaryota sp. GEM-RC1]
MGRQNPSEQRPRKRPNTKNKNTSVVGRTMIKKIYGKPKASVADPFAQTLSTNERIQADEAGPSKYSVTEVSDLDHLLDVAVLSSRNFEAEKERSTLLLSTALEKVVPHQREFDALREGHDRLTIPRRPSWDSDTTADELQVLERESFLEWRRQLAQIEETEQVVLTPFERNLDFWRQLWRVVEQSDVVLFIIDARNPYLFRCADLERYIKENNAKLIFLANKADLVPRLYRSSWKKYFQEVLGAELVYFSATHSLEHNLHDIIEDDEGYPTVDSEKMYFEDNGSTDDVTDVPVLTVKGLLSHLKGLSQSMDWKLSSTDTKEGIFRVGMVGYPNVGKSSAINALAGRKCVSVAATPGHTKHFQTIPLSKRLHLVDCPGLVFPAALYSKDELAVSGILPADTLRDTVSPAGVIMNRVSLKQINDVYSTDFTSIPECPYSFLGRIAEQKGLYCGKGQPDLHRIGRIILKDIFNGRILYCGKPYHHYTGELPEVEACDVGLKI